MIRNSHVPGIFIKLIIIKYLQRISMIIFIIIFNPYTVYSPILLETFANLIFRDLNGNIALGTLTIANVPKPIVNSIIIKISVINPTSRDFIRYIKFSNSNPLRLLSFSMIRRAPKYLFSNPRSFYIN